MLWVLLIAIRGIIHSIINRINSDDQHFCLYTLDRWLYHPCSRTVVRDIRRDSDMINPKQVNQYAHLFLYRRLMISIYMFFSFTCVLKLYIFIDLHIFTHQLDIEVDTNSCSQLLLRRTALRHRSSPSHWGANQPTLAATQPSKPANQPFVG